MNVSQSINESFHKGNASTKIRTLDKSSVIKNDTTLNSNNDFSRQTVFDRLYQNSRKKRIVKNGL